MPWLRLSAPSKVFHVVPARPPHRHVPSQPWKGSGTGKAHSPGSAVCLTTPVFRKFFPSPCLLMKLTLFLSLHFHQRWGIAIQYYLYKQLLFHVIRNKKCMPFFKNLLSALEKSIGPGSCIHPTMAPIWQEVWGEFIYVSRPQEFCRFCWKS